MAKTLPSHIEGLKAYLSQDSERNEDLALTYFRHLYGSKFKRQSDDEARGADGYVPGHFVLELKGSTNDWYSALFQGIAYRNKGLAFSIVIVAAKNFLAMWNISDLPSDIMDEIFQEKGAPSSIGKKIAKKYASKKMSLLKKAEWYRPEIFDPLFINKPESFKSAIKSFEESLEEKRKVRQPINTKNFTKVLSEMKQFFDPKQPIKTARAFYSMIYGPWDDSSVLNISQRHDDRATIGSEEIAHLVPNKRSKFKEFVENYSVQLSKDENIDDFFAKYDEALDAVDKDFRVKNGIFFTDLDLSKFVMWFVKQEIPSLGKNYLVIDPACGSGNLVTNWRSPLELRHKVVSEIEPELLFAVEQRMKGDSWHEGKFTVVPKVSENKGLNFLDKSADEYIEILKEYLAEKGHKPNKPLAFLCNPPYRSDDDQTAESINYHVDQEVVNLVGKDASSDRYLCFLAQMKLICDKAVDNGLPENSMLLLFTQTSWLTQRPLVQQIRREIFGAFEDVGGLLINGAEFFEGVGKFPIAFTMWRYKGKNAQLNQDRPIKLLDLCSLKKKDFSAIRWDEPGRVDEDCQEILKNGIAQTLGVTRTKFSGEWSGTTRRNLYRNLSKDEVKDKSTTHLGLPKGDSRHEMKTTFGYSKGTDISFMLDLTPCRTFLKDEEKNKLWFHLDSRFMKSRTARCMSGIPDRGYCGSTPEIASKLLTWFAMSRTFGTIGYPMWANMEEMWVPNIQEEHKEIVKQFSCSIAYAENDCISVSFPANNPVRGAGEIVSSNQMSPLDPDSYWNKHLAKDFSKKCIGTTKELVRAVDAIYLCWSTKLKNKKNIIPNYERTYLLSSDANLGLRAGLVQIRDFAQETNDSELLSLFDQLAVKLKIVKTEFHTFIQSKDGLNYFNQKASPNAIKQNVTMTKFEQTLERRKVAASLIIDELEKDENLGAVKLAKIIYIADQECNLELEAKYVKDVAGPMDGRMFYNSKIGLFPDQKSSEVGKIIETQFKKDGKTKIFKRILPSSQTSELSKKGKSIFSDKLSNIKSIIKLFRPLSTDHAEVVATIYACWNNLLLSKKKFTDNDIVNNFYKWSKDKKRFEEEDVFKTLKWMRSKKLIPKGKGLATQAKTNREKLDIPF